MSYTLLSKMLMKIKEKGVGREVKIELHVAVVAYWHSWAVGWSIMARMAILRGVARAGGPDSSAFRP